VWTIVTPFLPDHQDAGASTPWTGGSRMLPEKNLGFGEVKIAK